MPIIAIPHIYSPRAGRPRKAAILAELKKEASESAKKGPNRTNLPLIILVVALVAAAIVAGVGLTTISGATSYGCMSFSKQGSNVEITTSGIIHLSGTQYYVTCQEGETDPTTSTTYSCLTVTVHIQTYSYPDSDSEVWYYLSAGGHTITVPPLSVNSTEVLQPSQATITVDC